jgi:putative hydrolase of the HAD superfamily
MNHYSELFRVQCQPLQRIPTETEPKLRSLDEVRVVLFDVYGTMFISGSGDVGVAKETGTVEALSAAFRACGHTGPLDASQGVATLLATIRERHRRERERGIEYPEVEIVEIWRDCLQQMSSSGWLADLPEQFDVARLAVEYELRVNPAWPMPDLRSVLADLGRSGLALGIISNAQFFTLAMVTGLTGQTIEQLGFDHDLQFYSFHYRRAKPDRFLYELAATALAKRGVAPQNILYVGNDMLNDICPAGQVGFRTALFAGDRRSLRLREGDPRVSEVQPDLILTELQSLVGCLTGRAAGRTPAPGTESTRVKDDDHQDGT